MTLKKPIPDALEPGQVPVEASGYSFEGRPMTEEQIGQLRALSIQLNDPLAFSEDLTRAEADGRIKMLEAAIAR